MSLPALRPWDLPRLRFKFNWEKKKTERFLKKFFPILAKQHPLLFSKKRTFETLRGRGSFYASEGQVR